MCEDVCLFDNIFLLCVYGHVFVSVCEDVFIVCVRDNIFVYGS